MTDNLEDGKKNPSRHEFLKMMGVFGGTSAFMGYQGVKLVDWLFGYEPEIKPESGYWPNKPIELPGGQELNLVGVSHSHITFIKNKEDISERVARSDMVLLEYFEKVHREGGKPSLEVRDEQNLSLNESTHLFFSGVGSECAKSGKDIAVVNPETANSQLLEMFELFCVVPGSMAAAGIKVNERQRGMSRREFMVFAVASLVALWDWAGWVGKFKELIEEEEQAFAVRAEKTWGRSNPNLLRFTYLDWRDVATASKIMSLSEDNAGGDKKAVWTMFQGDGHSKGVLEYLSHPDMCRLKAATYVHYNLAARHEVPIWKFDNKKSEWVSKD